LFISLLAVVVTYRAYFAFIDTGFFPVADDFLSKLGVGAFIGYTLDSLAKKIYHKKTL